VNGLTILKRSRFVSAYLRLFICLTFLVNLFATSCPAHAAVEVTGGPAGESSILATETEAHELIRLAYSQAQATQGSPKGNASRPGVSGAGDEENSLEPDPWADEAKSLDSIPDPLEPMNRAFFIFNDKLYFWFFKPVGTGYKMVVPEVGRICIRNFFTNLITPIRAISCLLQGKVEGFGIELVRCVVNTTAGFLGFQDVARGALGFQIQDEDLGQVFAFYGIGPGCYLNLPFLGASSLRDTAGWVGELYLNPLDYMVKDFWPNVGFRSFDMLNKTSMRIGEYEALKKAAVDPYVAMRDAYYQYRLNQIEK
jgi:phospholipid-binding lipoprotein MlaA